MRVFIERFEGDQAIVETEHNEHVPMPRALLPQGARPGSVLTIALESGDRKKKLDSTAALIGELWKD